MRLRDCLLETYKPNTILRVVEPLALERGIGQSDTFGSDEKLVVISDDGVNCTVRSPRTMKKYVELSRVIQRATALASGQMPTRSASEIRGRRAY